MKELEKKQAIENFFTGSETFMSAIGATKSPRSIPLYAGMTLTLVVKPGTTIQDYLELGTFKDNSGVTTNYGMIVFSDASVSISKICRRGNGLKLRGATIEDMLYDLFGRAIQNGGSYTIEITDFKKVVYDGTPTEYPMLKGGTIRPLDVEEPQTPQTEEPQTA